MSDPAPAAPGPASGAAPGTTPTALDAFLSKWRTRWPEWQLAEGFVAADRRERVLAWFALLQEFEDALNISGDPLPADAKLAWWAEELLGWSRHRSRHPLGRVLEPRHAPWSALAAELPRLGQARVTHATAASAFESLLPLAQAAAAVEAELLGGEPQQATALVAQWLGARALVFGSAGTPLQVETPVAWLHTLAAAAKAPRTVARERRIQSALAAARLASARAGGDDGLPVLGKPRALGILWVSWRAARGA